MRFAHTCEDAVVADYIRWLREHIGHAPVQLNFVAACVVADDQVLLQRRADDGTWGFPGGAIELGESAEQALLREVAEETGLRIRISGMLGVYTKYWHTYPNGDKAQPITIFFRCARIGGTLSADDSESLELGLFPLNGAPPLINRQHEDAWADLRAGRKNVFR